MPNLNYGVEAKKKAGFSAKKDGDGADVAKVDANSGTKAEEQKNKLIESIIENPQITQNELAEILGVSRRTVQRITGELVNENKIIREGSRRAGHWKVLK